jgi:UDP-glucose 4,6-dehydratase
MGKGDYQPKSILLTGGAGFIGSHVLCLLAKKYPKVHIVCYDKLDYCSTTNNFKELNDLDNFDFVKGDICTADLISHVLKQFKIDTIMHFAAQTHVDNSFGNSIAFTQANVIGTHTLLEAAKAHKDQIRRFIHVSTDEVYGESSHDAQDKDRKTEDDALDPTNPYAATKVSAEYLVKSYRKSFGLPTIITRGNNVYGPKQFPEKLIPKFINLLRLGRKVCLHGDGSNQRSFLYVGDVANAFDIILHKGKVGEIYNIGTDYELSNLQVAQILIKLAGHDKAEDHMEFVRDRAFNDCRYHIDTSSLESLGWKREIDFEEGLRLTREWYLGHDQWWGNIENALKAHPTVAPTVSASSHDGEPPAKKQKV